MAVRTSTSFGMLFLPIIVAVGIHVTVTPLAEIISIEPLIGVGFYCGAGLVGIFLFRKTRKEKNSEFNRNKAMKSLRKTLEQEDSGVWDNDMNLESTLGTVNSKEVRGTIGDYNSESAEIELGNEKKVDVDLLLESKYVVKATRNMKGEDNYSETEVTIGSETKSSFMDNLLDGIGGLFGRDLKADRIEKRNNALKAASDSAPIYAQKPRAPINSSSNQSSNDDLIQEGLKSSGRAGPQQKIRFDKSGNEVPVVNHESIEAMAMIGSSNPSAIQTVQTLPSNVKVCSECGYKNQITESYCVNCGNNL